MTDATQIATLGVRFSARLFKNKIFQNNNLNLISSHGGTEAATMVTVHLEMEPFSGPIDLSKTALIIIDMQVRIWWSGFKRKGGTRSPL
jgi:hypothetical protein